MRYLEIEDTKRIYAYSGYVNMCKGIPGLRKLVKEDLHKDPGSGDLFVFVNEKRSYLKILAYSKGGNCLFCKKLDEGTFRKIKGKVLDEQTLMDLINVTITVIEDKNPAIEEL